MLKYLTFFPTTEHQQPVQCLESGSPAAVGSRCAQARPLHRVRRRRASPAHRHVRPHRTLVRLHLVHHRRHGGRQGNHLNLVAVPGVRSTKK